VATTIAGITATSRPACSCVHYYQWSAWHDYLLGAFQDKYYQHGICQRCAAVAPSGDVSSVPTAEIDPKQVPQFGLVAEGGG